MKKDSRIKKEHISWKDFLIIFFVLSVLTAGQAMIYNSYIKTENVPIGYIFGIIGYWLLISLAFCLITRFLIYQTYDKPMQTFCRATRNVANGDFSVWLEPIHKAGKEDYLDVMFADFNKMVEELNSIETLKNDFVSNVSHEIKTPIAVIQSYAEALQKENLSTANKQDYIRTIINASQKLSTLVTNILKLNKLENQQIMRIAEPYDLCRQLSDCALAFENQWEAKHIHFEADIEDKLIVVADESMLEIIWNNLIANAIKFTNSHGTIILKQTSENDSVTISVQDSGIGMSEETLKHIFDKFYQGDISKLQEGNGLGLALAYKVVELIKGEISVKSKLGIGTIFTVKFDISASSQCLK